MSEPDPEATDGGKGDERPTARQILHAATGDRDAEAQALADQGSDVSEEEARIAVQRAHGEAGSDAPQTGSDIAHPEDAEAVRRERQQ
jgi:hypothetical protein